MVKQLKQRALWARTLSEEQRNPDGQRPNDGRRWNRLERFPRRCSAAPESKKANPAAFADEPAYAAA